MRTAVEGATDGRQSHATLDEKTLTLQRQHLRWRGDVDNVSDDDDHDYYYVDDVNDDDDDDDDDDVMMLMMTAISMTIYMYCSHSHTYTQTHFTQ